MEKYYTTAAWIIFMIMFCLMTASIATIGRRKKKRSLEDQILDRIYNTYPMSRKDIRNIYERCGFSYDRTIHIIEYKLEYNLSTESAINLLV